MAKEKSKGGRGMKTTHFLIIILILLVASQAFTIYLIHAKSQESLTAINQSEKTLNEKINLNNQDIQSKINTLTTSISEVSSVQSDFEEELGEIKASASADFSDIIDREIQGVVTIKTDISQGTGFIVTDDGFVVTNHHVVNGATAASVFTYDTQAHSVALIGSNPTMDIAVLKIEGNFQALDLGNSDDVKIGEKVIAIGNPLGLAFTATEGIISAKGRVGTNNLPYYFQTDVSLNPGNSGGPLINTDGEVIGINNFKISGADNLGFALEINPAKETINQITLQSHNSTIV
jgi:S1-C subfamily serine protease